MPSRTHLRYLTIAAGIALLAAIPPIWPYVYYQLLRWFICIVALLNVFESQKNKNTGEVTVMVIIAILFNPIAPFFLTKEIWAALDFVTALLMFPAAKK